MMDDFVLVSRPFITRKMKVTPISNSAVSVSEAEGPINLGKNISSKNFLSLGVDTWLANVLAGLAIYRPSPVQSASIPLLLGGKDVIASAKTGSGKTAAFALPILHSLARDPYGFFAVILTPTRELAIQIAEQVQALGKDIKLSVCVAVGGLDMMKQSLEISKKPHIVIATPGRFVDIIDSCNISMPHLRYLVLDEADRLVDPTSSFMKHEIPFIVGHVGNPSTNWSFFSATMTQSVSEFYMKYRLPDKLAIYNGNAQLRTPESLKQSYMLIPSQVKDAYLVNLLRGSLAGRTAIIFVGKCKTCELITGLLRKLNFKVVAIHGKMTQMSRLASLQKFRIGKASMLVTTDVASRGLDIPMVEFVVNFDLPSDPNDYIHRVGRAARAGRSGEAISFVHELDIDLLDSIGERIGKEITPYQDLPKEKDVLQILNSVSSAKRKVSMNLHDRKFGLKADVNRRKQGG